MTAQAVAFPVAQAQEPALGALTYFQQCRIDCIRRYKASQFWVTRRDARKNALHYARLVRKLEGRA